MLKPSAEIILNTKLSRYSLVVAIAKRAREIAGDAEMRGEIIVEKPVDLAVQEFLKHKFMIIEHQEPNDDDTEQP
ncbi:MAG TPA: DNA-directed RNA polymerase subunit omega [Caproiciproducens sp.]|jgi:DNA-directed RNA polymerase, subunit K/omega|nr:DNA-directed RNA polymerase subunit omega [Caproiciproducens sp.]